MLQDPQLRPPVLGRLLVQAVSWLVPTHARSVWRCQWDSVLQNAWTLFERGELNRNDLLGGVGHCVSDAWKKSSFSHRSPRFVLLAALMALVIIGILSHGFIATRSLFRPLPVENAERLVWIQYTGSVGQPIGVPPRFLPVWRANSSLLSGLAAYWHRPYAPYARVTTNFFAVLGTRPAQGRLFQSQDRDAAILSAAAWKTRFGSDPRVLGRQIRVEGKIYTIVGVLPASFWAISPRVTVWMPLQLEPQPERGVPVLVPAVGRLKLGVSREALRSDLFNAARAAHQFLPRRPEVVAFTAIPGALLPGYLFGIAFAIGVAAVIISLQQGLRFHNGWRYWRFLLAKTVLLAAIPSLAWVESRLTGLLFSIPFLAACSLGFWWSLADQRRRCPECLERLALPVTMGSWSSVLDPVSTEFVCESGHGSLCVPETGGGEPDRWMALDPSWRELFEKAAPGL